METALELAPEQPGEAPMKQLAPFDAQRIEAEKLKKTAETLTVTSITDKAGMALARTTRLALKAVRVEVTHRHKELKEHILIEGRKIDAGKNEILALIEPLEERLLEQEQFAERAEAARKEELRTMRAEELQAFGVNSSFINLAEMPEAEYEALFNNSKSAHEAKIAAEKKAEEDRIAKEKAEAEERQRIAAENVRLKEEARQREECLKAERAKAEAAAKAAAEKARKEREALEAKARAEREAAEAKAKDEREKAAEAARVAAEKARKEREAIEAKAKAEREASEMKAKKERDAREKAEAELKAKRDAEEKARKEAEAAARKAARAPDKTKLTTYIGTIMNIECQSLSSYEAMAILGEIHDRLNALQELVTERTMAL